MGLEKHLRGNLGGSCQQRKKAGNPGEPQPGGTLRCLKGLEECEVFWELYKCLRGDWSSPGIPEHTQEWVLRPLGICEI